MICIEDFDINSGFFVLCFKKGKEYTLQEINGKKYICVGLFEVPLERVADKFKEV